MNDLSFSLLISIGQSPLLGGARLLLGLAFVLLAPGYAIQAALFPRRGDLSGPERWALSFGISLAAIPILSLVLTQLLWGLRLESVIIASAGVTVVAAGTAWVVRRRIPFAGETAPAGRGGIRDAHSHRIPKSGGAAVALALGGVLLLGFVFQTARQGEPVTEFYLLGAEGQAESYPYRGVVGEPVTVTVGIVNREGVPVAYRLEVVDGENLLGQMGPMVLGDGETYEGPVSFTLVRAGEPLRVEFLLYRNGLPLPYRRLWLWLEVVE